MKLLQKTPAYCITFKESINLYIGVTNFSRYWMSCVTRNSFLAGLKEANEGVEFQEWDELINMGIDMLKNPESLNKVCVLEDDSHIVISLQKNFSFPIKLELGLLEASAAHFFQMAVQPLVKTVCDLHASQFELRELLRLKDREIEKYRSDGFVPKRSHLPVYDDAAHIEKHNTYQRYFGAPGVQDLLTELSNVDVEADIKPGVSGPVLQNEHADSTEVQPTGIVDLPEISHKIEKCSQNTLMDEIASIVPVHLDESNIKSFTTVSNRQTAEVKTDSETESKGQTRKKRRLNRLDY